MTSADSSEQRKFTVEHGTDLLRTGTDRLDELSVADTVFRPVRDDTHQVFGFEAVDCGLEGDKVIGNQKIIPTL